VKGIFFSEVTLPPFSRCTLRRITVGCHSPFVTVNIRQKPYYCWYTWQAHGLYLYNFCYQLEQVTMSEPLSRVFTAVIDKIMVLFSFFLHFAAVTSQTTTNRPIYQNVCFLHISASTWKSWISPKWRLYLPMKRGAETQMETNIWCFVDFPEWQFSTLIWPIKIIDSIRQ
jgi:hypothetical protein